MPNCNFLGIRVCLQAGRCPGLLSSPLLTNTAMPPHEESQRRQKVVFRKRKEHWFWQEQDTRASAQIFTCMHKDKWASE